MEFLLHTIALVPARWTPQRVANPLVELLPAIARAGFRRVEVFEPHLALAADEEALPRLFASLRLESVILSSYFNVNPAVTSDAAFEAGLQEVEARVRRFEFRKVRLFPGAGVKPSDEAAVGVVTERIATVAQRLPEVEFLLESHDGSIADSPERLVQLVRELAVPNVGILFQPTVFEAEPALRQLEIEKSLIRHLHLQNRAVGDAGKFVRLSEGAVPWQKIVQGLADNPHIAATLEFIPSAICPVDQFDRSQSLAEAVAESEYFQAL